MTEVFVFIGFILSLNAAYAQNQADDAQRRPGHAQQAMGVAVGVQSAVTTQSGGSTGATGGITLVDFQMFGHGQIFPAWTDHLMTTYHLQLGVDASLDSARTFFLPTLGLGYDATASLGVTGSQSSENKHGQFLAGGTLRSGVHPHLGGHLLGDQDYMGAGAEVGGRFSAFHDKVSIPLTVFCEFLEQMNVIGTRGGGPMVSEDKARTEQHTKGVYCGPRALLSVASGEDLNVLIDARLFASIWAEVDSRSPGAVEAASSIGGELNALIRAGSTYGGISVRHEAIVDHSLPRNSATTSIDTAQAVIGWGKGGSAGTAH